MDFTNMSLGLQHIEEIDVAKSTKMRRGKSVLWMGSSYRLPDINFILIHDIVL